MGSLASREGKFIDEVVVVVVVVGESSCDMTEPAKRAAASKIIIYCY